MFIYQLSISTWIRLGFLPFFPRNQVESTSLTAGYMYQYGQYNKLAIRLKNNNIKLIITATQQYQKPISILSKVLNNHRDPKSQRHLVTKKNAKSPRRCHAGLRWGSEQFCCFPIQLQSLKLKCCNRLVGSYIYPSRGLSDWFIHRIISLVKSG